MSTEIQEPRTNTESVGLVGASLAPRTIVTAVGISIGGLLVHNLTEFPLSILFGPETLVPVAITILLGVAMLLWPGRPVYVATAGWALVVIVGGGVSVLPLSILPFVPEQTVGHYLVHGGYALAQLPLLWTAWRGFRTDQSRN